ncbi:MAG: hypothetical protein A2046_03580 [Bacteroidetes bacterium GWA2_30_7]|nr:MAG: hypothetical protein A2046_03580 [Bacteroidetes bacterium GWA2_30_7]
MKSKLFTFLLIFGVITLGMVGCKKDKEEPEPEPQPVTTTKPSIASKTQIVTVPTKLQSSTDSNAATAVGYLNTMNSLTTYTSIFTPPANATHSTNKNSTDTWNWTYDDGQGHTFAFVYTYSVTSTQHIWDIKLGINGATPVDYAHAEETLDGTVGNMSFYYSALSNYAGTDLSNYYWYYTWNVDANGYGNITMEAHNGTTDVLKYTATVNSDGSGEVNYYINSVLKYRLTWTAAGTGTWYVYDENGTETTGTWS